MSFLLIDIDPIFKTFKNQTDLKDCSAGGFSTFSISEIWGFPKYDFPKTICGFLVFSLNILGVFGIKKNWFWESWSCPLGPTIMKIRTFLNVGM